MNEQDQPMENEDELIVMATHIEHGRTLQQSDADRLYEASDEMRNLRRERDEARARIRTMRNALNGLIDVQNGPPLVQHEAEWQDAVLEAEEAAKPVAGDLWGTCFKCGAAVEYVGPESVTCTNKACELAASAAKEGE